MVPLFEKALISRHEVRGIAGRCHGDFVRGAQSVRSRGGGFGSGHRATAQLKALFELSCRCQVPVLPTHLSVVRLGPASISKNSARILTSFLREPQPVGDMRHTARVGCWNICLLASLLY